MTPTQKIIKEFDKKFPQFMEFPQAFQGLDPDREQIKSFLLSSLRQIATEAIEAVKLETKKEAEMRLDDNLSIHKNGYGVGYNLAVSDMENKAKKFLEDN